VPGFPLHQALQECTSELLSHGGHASAAGFRVARDAISAFRRRFVEVATRLLGAQAPPPCLTLDAEVPLSCLTNGLMQALEQLERFGAGNPPPALLTGPVAIQGQPKKVGQGERHLVFRVRQDGRTLKAVAFNMAEREQELLSAGGQCCLAFIPRFNEWQGWRSIELEVLDFQAGPVARLQ